MKRLALALLLGLAPACYEGPVSVKTAPGFLELPEDDTYAYRATTPEGVVLGVRVIDASGAGGRDLAFWTRALTAQLRDVRGYDLVGSADVRSRDGVPGKQLRFRHEERGETYDYWLTFFAPEDRLLLAEAGGVERRFEAAEPSIAWMLSSLEIR